MNTVAKQNVCYSSIEEYEKSCYLLSPSISKLRLINGNPYYVRRYFRGGLDFEKAVKQLVIKDSYKCEVIL